MPHLLMSNDEPEAAAAPAEPNPAEPTATDSTPTVLQFRRLSHATHRIVRPRQLRGTDPGLEPLRRQSRSIIAEVLADTNPDQAEVRDKLR